MINTDYEIGLIDILNKLVEQKILIASCALIGFSLGLLYSYQTTPQYYITVNFQTKFYLPSAHRMCSDNINCLNEETNKRLYQFLEDNWEVGYDHKRIHKVSSIDAKEAHQHNIDEIIKVFTNFVYDDAKKELATLSGGVNTHHIVESNNIWRHILSVRRIVDAIENGEKIVQFKEIKIRLKSPNYYINIMMFSILAFLGGIIIALFKFVTGEKLEKQE